MTAPAEPFAAVYFDCDSTLSAIEGIDALLDGADPRLRAEVTALTTQAMDGDLPLAEVYERRLQLVAPSAAQLARVGEVYCERVTPFAREVVAALRHLGKHVGVVSGGLLPAVLPFGRFLGVDDADVHAVPVRFAADGSYADFDRGSHLWQNGGKVAVLRALPPDRRPLAFVGDGATDLEVQGAAAERFIGFGGVVARDHVRRAAAVWFDAPTLAPLLPLVLTAPELRRLADQPAFAALLSAARR